VEDDYYPFLKVSATTDLANTLEASVNSLLKLMYKTCKNQKERIQANLVHYKGYLIIRKLIQGFKMAKLKRNAAKVIKI
jgi:uncharacterized protein YaaQ